MKIDFHSHLYPAEFFDLMVKLGRNDLSKVHTQDLDLGGWVESQDKAGVNVQVLSFVGLNAVVEDPHGATDAAQCLNDIYERVCLRYPGRFLSFCMLPLPHVDRSIDEISRALDAKTTAIGVAVPCSVDGTPLDDAQFEPLWAELHSRGALVFVHPVGGDSAGHWGMGDWGLGAMFGSPMQLGIAATRLVFSGVTSRYPNIQFLFAQGGGFLPARWEAIENIVLRPGFAGHAPYMLGWVNDLDLNRDDPMSGFRNFLFDTAGLHQMPTNLTAARATYGVDRLVLGSDSAFGSLVESVNFIQSSAELSAEERDSVLSGWAQSLVPER